MAASGLCPRTLSLTAKIVVGALTYFKKRESCPTHKPIIILNSVFASFRILACEIGLHMLS